MPTQLPINQKTEPMTKTQKVIIEIYNEFRRVCNKNGLFFMASDGTLLGAVREGGFIPHDDDIDVTMPITDAEELIKIWDKQSQFPYYKISWFRNLHCIKIHDTRTTHIEFSRISHFDTHEGIFLDIFPFIGLPADQIKRENLISRVKQQRQLTARAYYRREKSYTKELAKLRKMYHEVPVNDAEYFVELDVFYNVYKKDKWFNTIDAKFEGARIPIPLNYEERLSSQYGPKFHHRLPENEQVSHHTIGAIVDFELPYTYYSELLGKFSREFLMQLESITDSYHSAFGYNSYKQGRLYMLEQQIRAKDEVIAEKDEELRSLLRVKRSLRLLMGNVKRKIVSSTQQFTTFLCK